MLDATGGDTAALAEINAAVALVSTSHSPDLLAALRLAWYRDQLAERNTHIPAQLPGVWATLGQPGRAEALARSITAPGVQARALASVAEAAAGGGDLDRAEQVARSITAPGVQARALASVAEAAAGSGDLDRAERVARSITAPDAQARALASVAAAAAGSGDLDRAERVARSITAPDEQAWALASVASVAEPARARSCIAGALAVGRWVIPLRELARIDPAALAAFADERAALHGLLDQLDNGLLSGTSAAHGCGWTGGPGSLPARDSGTLSGISGPRHRGGGMARRTITIVFDENLTDEEYADFGNGIWGALKMAHPAGGFHLESDGATTVQYLNDRWAQHGGQLPWQ